jgi:hypothetical protein
MYNHFLYQSLVDELRGIFKYLAFIPSRRFRYAPPAILDPPAPPFFLRQKKCHHRFTEGNEDGHSKNGVGVKIADANFIIITKFAQKGMARISKSTPIEIFEDDNLARTGVWIVLIG